MMGYQEGGRVVGTTMTDRGLTSMVMQPDGTVSTRAEGPSVETQHKAGQALLGQLRAMRGSKTDFEYQKAQHLVGRMGKDPEENAQILAFLGISAGPPEPLNNTQLSRRLRSGKDVEEIEADQIERSYNSIGTGGRIEKYANGALEWVPNGPGDIPQPPTGDVFFDPIAEEQRKVGQAGERRKTLQGLSSNDRRWIEQQIGRPIKFARGGAVKKFQTGGLAAATDLEEEEEELFDPSSVTGTEEIIPDPLGELRKMATMTKDDALARLRESRETLAARRTKQEKRADQDRWLALAQGMLAPTKTGAFGENVGMAAGHLRGANALSFEQSQAIAEEEERLLHREYEIAGDYFDSLANLEGFQNNSRARVVGTSTAIHPHDQPLVISGDMKESDARRVMVSTIMQPDGETISRVETTDGTPFGEGGEPFMIVDPRKVPSQAAAQTAATVGADQAVKTQYQVAKLGMDAIPMVTRLQRAYGLLSSLREDTSGLNEKIRTVAQWAGISEVIDDNVTLATLQKMFGAQILQDLRLLTGSKTDFEYMKVEGQNARLGASVEENLGIIDEHMLMLNEMVDKGEFAAQNLSEGPGTEERGFMLQQYLRHRKSQAELAAEYDAETRQAPPHQIESLLQKMQEAQGNPDEQGQLIKEFREYYDIPEDIALQLRKSGVAI